MSRIPVRPGMTTRPRRLPPLEVSSPEPSPLRWADSASWTNVLSPSGEVEDDRLGLCRSVSTPMLRKGISVTSAGTSLDTSLRRRIRRLSKELINSISCAWTQKTGGEASYKRRQQLEQKQQLKQQQQPPPLTESQLMRMLEQYDTSGGIVPTTPCTAERGSATDTASSSVASPLRPDVDPGATDEPNAEQPLSPARRGAFLSGLLDASLPPMPRPKTKHGAFLARLAELARGDLKHLAAIMNEYDRDGTGELNREEFYKMVLTYAKHIRRSRKSLGRFG